MKNNKLINTKIMELKENNNIYIKHYKPNDIYWGLGIENESYIKEKNKLKNNITIFGNDFLDRIKQERHSLNYYENYQDDLFNKKIKLFDVNDVIRIPKFINCHTLHKMNRHGILKYDKYIGLTTPINNVNFSGKTLHDEFIESKLFDYFDKKYVYDSDTIEFMTQNFYKTTVIDIVNELIEIKTEYLNNLNNFLYTIPELTIPSSLINLPLEYPTFNYGFVNFPTNYKNISIFNNGTYHLNITLPTQLNDLGEIDDELLFEKKHLYIIKLLQWFMIFIVCAYGSGDVMSIFNNTNDIFFEGSLRLGMSRYISVGTYNCDIGEKGKILKSLRNNIKEINTDKSWYNKLYNNCAYKKLDYIGYDINYNKHYNMGIEIRIFDFFPEKCLYDIINYILLIIDHGMYLFENNYELDRAINDETWNNMLFKTLKYGYTSKIDNDNELQNIILMLEKLKINTTLNKLLCVNTKYIDINNIIIDYLYDFNKFHSISSIMSPNMKKPLVYNINRYNFEMNYLQYLPINDNSKQMMTLYNLSKKYKNNETVNKKEKYIKLLETLNLINNKMEYNDFVQYVKIKKSEILDDKNFYFNYVN